MPAHPWLPEAQRKLHEHPLHADARRAASLLNVSQAGCTSMQASAGAGGEFAGQRESPETPYQVLQPSAGLSRLDNQLVRRTQGVS